MKSPLPSAEAAGSVPDVPALTERISSFQVLIMKGRPPNVQRSRAEKRELSPELG